MPGSLVEFSNAIAEVVERAGASVVGVLEGGREGVSGTIVREGYAVTAEHTIRGEDEVTVVLASGDNVKATVAGRDPGTEIALLKLPVKEGAAAKPARLTGNARVGELALLVGRRGTEGITATHGIVSAVGGSWTTWQGGRIERWLRLDLDPFVGFSGGPIVNAAGEVLGIATSGPRRSVLTIPAATIERVVDALIQRGHVPQPWIGIAMQPVAFPEGSWKSLGIEHDRGLLVVTVAPGSPAEKAGILLGDVILTIDGRPVRSPRSLQAALDSEKIGKPVPIKLVRGGKLVEVSVTVGERPEN
ncbi:MAG TPA: S1C family serine protease [Acidobacteriaceae bacterium]|nr:S1C family serine protease [Acidobacteriaceae bacterium]